MVKDITAFRHCTEYLSLVVLQSSSISCIETLFMTIHKNKFTDLQI